MTGRVTPQPRAGKGVRTRSRSPSSPAWERVSRTPSPDRSACGRLGAADSVRASAPERRVPWEEDRVRGRFVLRFRVGESAAAQGPNPRVGRKFGSIKTIYFAANDSRPL